MQLSKKTSSAPWTNLLSSKSLFIKQQSPRKTKIETYTGLTRTTMGNHKTYFKNPNENHSSLPRRIQKLEKKNITHSIKWEKVSHAKPLLSSFRNMFHVCVPQKNFTLTINKKSKMYLKTSAHADGGLRSQVCACKTLRSAPIDMSRSFPAHMSAESPSNISPKPLRSCI